MAVADPDLSIGTEVIDAPVPEEIHAPSFSEKVTLRILQIGGLAAILAVTTYLPFELDRFFIPKDFVLHVTAFLVGLFTLVASRKIRISRIDVYLGGFLLLGALSSLLATNPWIALRALSISLSGAVLFWSARRLQQVGLGRSVIHGLYAMVLLATLTSLLQAYGVESTWFSVNRAPGGTLSNRNFVAHLAAIGFPILLLATFRAERTGGFLLGCLGLIPVAASLVLTRSRAAWLGFAALFAILILGALFTPSVRSSGKLILRFILIAVFIGGGVAAALVLPNTLRWNSDSPYLETARGVVNYREGSGRGRLIQYTRTLKMAVFHPVLGVGPGNWRINYPEYAARNDASMSTRDPGMTTNPWPSSDWMAIISERGLAATLLYVLVWIGLALAAWRRMRTSIDKADGIDALCLLSLLAATATVGVFDAVLLLSWPTFFFWTAAGALLFLDERAEKNVSSVFKVLFFFLLTGCAAIGSVHSAGQINGMSAFVTNGNVQDLERAVRLDPGSYRLRSRLVKRYRADRDKRCEHARSLYDLFPNVNEARRLARPCGE